MFGNQQTPGLSARHWRLRPGSFSLAIVLTILVPVASASAAVSGSASVSLPGEIAVGETASGSFTIQNTNTAPNETEYNVLQTVHLVPSCVVPPTESAHCSVPDLDVFDLSPNGTGTVGTACAGASFFLHEPSPPDGVVTVELTSQVALGPPGGSPGSDRCTVDFTFTVRKSPAADSNTFVAGKQTRFNIFSQEHAPVSDEFTENRGSTEITIAPGSDSDSDGVVDNFDNCPVVANATQANFDEDPQGDACDGDDDNDGLADAADACATGVSTGSDADGDGCKDSEDADDDGDGVTDASDTCDLLTGRAANGCPRIKRRLTLAYKPAINTFKGKLGPAGLCAMGSKVKVFRKKTGPDKLIAKATTKPPGKYKVRKKNPDPGNYYAKVSPKTVPDFGNCLAKKSKPISIR